MKKSFFGFIETFAVGLILAFLVMVFVGQSLEIIGNSMFPTLVDKERIIVEKVTYKSRMPKRGEIVVFRSFQNDTVFLIKRVIAIPGDTISATKGNLYLNGKILNEPYLPKETETNDLEELNAYINTPIPKDYIVVMGDNRDESFDSRMFGPIPLDKIVGKAFLVYWPLVKIRGL